MSLRMQFMRITKVIIEYVGIHQQEFKLFAYMHKKQIPMQEWICMKCPQTSHVEGDQFLHWSPF